MKQFIAGENEQDMRLSRFVLAVAPKLPSSLLYKSFRNKRIKINGKREGADYRIVKGDIIELYINDEFFATNGEEGAKKRPANKKRAHKLHILFEDENIAAIYKPAHMLCHSDKTGDDNLTDIFRDYLKEKGDYLPESEHTFSPSVCNRLDRGTSGIVIAAKNYTALKDMNELIKGGFVTKKYVCITFCAPAEGIHTAFLKHDEKTNKVNVINKLKDDYKLIKTGVIILKKRPPFFLCEVDLFTGRTHQIRAHLAHLGAPILGDIKYGNKKINAKTGAKTQALCAYKFTFNNDIPEDNCLNYLKGQTVHVENAHVFLMFNELL